MAITRDQALNARYFHVVSSYDGKCDTWRRNGQTKTWKRSPERFRVPVKYGMYSYGYFDEHDLDRTDLHAAEDCPHSA
jgi:hypothetical protein